MLARRLVTGTSLPIFNTGSEIIQGSDRILDWTGVVDGDDAIEQRFERRIGPLVRQYIYSGVLNDTGTEIREVLMDGVNQMQATAGRLMWPVTRRVMIASMDCRACLTPKLQDELGVELDWFEMRLQARNYLVGRQLGRADITAASLLAPLARPESLPLYRRLQLPSVVERQLADWVDRPSMRWVRRTYDLHRRKT
jgi:glutathione S-transferase